MTRRTDRLAWTAAKKDWKSPAAMLVDVGGQVPVSIWECCICSDYAAEVLVIDTVSVVAVSENAKNNGQADFWRGETGKVVGTKEKSDKRCCIREVPFQRGPSFDLSRVCMEGLGRVF
jgi:hypothetical protein